MKIGACNRIKGTIVDVTKGQTTAPVRIDVGNGVTITSSITNETVDELGLKVGDAALPIRFAPVRLVDDAGRRSSCRRRPTA